MAVGDIAIRIGDDADEVTQFAAQELRKYLNEAAGQEVCQFGESGDIAIRVGIDGDLPEDAHPETVTMDVSADGQIALGGKRPRGVLYAVYGFLEDVVGCRWFYPGEDIVPALGASGLEVRLREFIESGERRVERPDFDIRMRRFLVYDLGESGTPIADETMRQMQLDIDWMAKNRMNIFQFALDHNWDCYTHWDDVREAIPEMHKRGIVPGMGGHNMHMFMTAEDLKEHPEWRPYYNGQRQMHGQFCTSNEAAVDHYIGGLLEFLDENPEIEYLAPWPNDTGGWCQCEKCKDTPMPDRYMALGRRIYEELTAQHPDVTLTHFAYGTHMDPPHSERPVAGMTVTLCTWGRDFSEAFYSEQTSERFREAFAAWRDICADAGVPLILHEKYARHLYLGQHPLPLPVLQQDLRWFEGQGLDGFELPMAYMGRRTKGLNLYVLSRLMWDTEADVGQMVDDYFDNEYGEMAGAVRKVYEGVEGAMSDYRYSFDNFSKIGLRLKPGMRVSRDLRNYARGARDAVAAGLGLLRELDGEPAAQDVRERIERLRRSLRYLQAEWGGLDDIGRAARAMAQAQLADTQDEYLRRLERARAAIVAARECDAARTEMISNVEDLELFWDVTGHGPSGVFNGDILDDWLKLIDGMREKDVADLPRKVWQIGFIDGSGAELGEGANQRAVMLTMPPVVRYEIPDDWMDRGHWPAFPRSHWPNQLAHGGRIELVFSAPKGKYRLIVGQLRTWEAETVTVLLDGNDVGEYTTDATDNSRHEVEFEIAADGEHTLVLQEFEEGGGYEFDGLWLERMGE